MYESHSDKVLRHRRKWNAKNPAKARRIAMTWRIFWSVSVLALAGASIYAASSGDVLAVVIVLIIGLTLVGIVGGILAAVLSDMRGEPSDGEQTQIIFSD